ncbi:HlyD family type I secretion periplasmic adaptor subunit [Rhodovulum steppense]|uniref:Membrane fusion protein (MFP) family protein n=1 Tax=Rhodovulum steppense TaxID=540251 RepID=A0A4R1YMT8_9RHOB|nr:HlyD family type I secretion periplasmic adaptor subunit [Rhodovulum steppense]TCM78992.1 membrane fusion protein PrsE [Rhodovulum steppense]
MNNSDMPSAKLPLALGAIAMFLLVGGVGVWGATANISGAIIASGTIKVESERQVVQHPHGGVVGEILAKEGDKVKAGDVVVRLDGTFIRSELAIIEQQLMELHARKVRLEAERDGAEKMVLQVPEEFSHLDLFWTQGQIEGQESLFVARRLALVQETEQLHEQAVQIEKQIQGTSAQVTALNKQLTLIERELTSKMTLYEQNLIPVGQVLELQRNQAGLEGDIGRLTSQAAELRARISEQAIKGLRLKENRREDAISQLRDLQYSEIELRERRLSLTEQLARLDVRSPADGIVLGSTVFAISSVVKAAEPMMYVVPGDQGLLISARIETTDVDQVFPGQMVSLQLTTFDSRITPQFDGKVLRVSPDALTDAATRATYYEVIIEPDISILATRPDLRLLPGMPVETFLKTSERTALSYLMRPLAIYFDRAFRES